MIISLCLVLVVHSSRLPRDFRSAHRFDRLDTGQCPQIRMRYPRIRSLDGQKEVDSMIKSCEGIDSALILGGSSEVYIPALAGSAASFP
jgi:hypothetical protein